MKLGGAPGTLLICGIALDCSRCATKNAQYKLCSDSRFRDHSFSRSLTYELSHGHIVHCDRGNSPP